MSTSNTLVSFTMTCILYVVQSGLMLVPLNLILLHEKSCKFGAG